MLTVIILGFVRMLTDVSSEMVYPLVPFYLTMTPGAPPAIVGIIEGIAESLASLLKTCSGHVSDTTRPRGICPRSTPSRARTRIPTPRESRCVRCHPFRVPRFGIVVISTVLAFLSVGCGGREGPRGTVAVIRGGDVWVETLSDARRIRLTWDGLNASPRLSWPSGDGGGGNGPRRVTGKAPPGRGGGRAS